MNPLKTKTLMISRSRTLVPIVLNFVLDGAVVERVTELKVLDVVLDSKLSFEGHIRSIAVSASSKFRIMSKALCLFGDPVIVLRCFWSFLCWSTVLLFGCLLQLLILVFLIVLR